MSIYQNKDPEKPKVLFLWPKVISVVKINGSIIHYSDLGINRICPGVFLSDHASGVRDIVSLSLNPDRKTLNLAQSQFVLLQKQWQKKTFNIKAIGMMTSLIMSILFEKLCQKCLKYKFFSNIHLVTAKNRFSTSSFSFWKSR